MNRNFSNRGIFLIEKILNKMNTNIDKSLYNIINHVKIKLQGGTYGKNEKWNINGIKKEETNLKPIM